MPKIRRIEDSSGVGNPLRITTRRARQRTAPSIRVKCGCCDKALVICHDAQPTGNPHADILEIGGVMGTVNQWKQVFLPLFGIKG